MGLGLSKSFIIFLALSIALAFWSNNFWNGFWLMVIYAVVRSVWKLLTE